jgi:hypothetical protein
LLNNLKIVPALEVAELFRRTMGDVARASGNKQFPAVYNQFPGIAYLGRAPAQPAPAPQPVPAGLEWEAEGSGVTITDYTGTASALNIPDRINGLPVTKIGNGAFSDRTGLTSVTIPSSITSIGIWAFAACTGLASVTIPSSITSIGARAFDACTGLTAISVDPRNTVYTSIDGVLFDKVGRTLVLCPSGKTSVTISASVTAIDIYAFDGCENLTSITVDPRNPKYASREGVLFDKEISRIEKYPAGKIGAYSIPASVTYLDNELNDCRGLTSLTIPASVTYIGGEVPFQGCENLTSITVDPRNPNYASRDGVLFEQRGELRDGTILNKENQVIMKYPPGKSGSSYTIPASVVYICEEAFSRCHNLTSIMVDTRNPNYASRDGVLFDKEMQTLIQYPAGKTGAYVIPASVTTIEYAFRGCSGLTSLTIPATVDTMGGITYNSGAFDGCTNLKTVILSRRSQLSSDNFPDGAQIRYSD